MHLESSIFRSAIARRMFLLFVVCAMVPIVLLTGFTARMLTTYFDEQVDAALQSASKAAGMALIGRLDRVESDVRGIAALMSAGGTASGDPAMQRYLRQLSSRISGAAVVGEGSVVPLFGGDVSPVAELLSPGEVGPQAVRLFQMLDQHGATRFFLAIGTDGPTASPAAGGAPSVAPVIAAEVDPGFLWSLDGTLELPWNAGLTVYDHGGRLLHSSLDHVNGLRAALEHGRSSGTRREFSWDAPDGAQRAMAWTAFLEAQFGHPGWTVIVTEPATRSAQTLSWVSETLPRVILLCLAIVAVLSMVQIRRSLIPVVRLTEGTARVARGEFDARVDVETNDEFGRLAQSFNTMAARIGDQFETLNTLAGIDREMLSTLDESRIVSTLLDRAPDRLHCRGAALIVADDDASGTVSIWHGAPGQRSEQRAVLASGEGRFMGDQLDPRLVPAADLPYWLISLLGGRSESCLLVPARHGGIRGLLVLGYGADRLPVAEVRIEAQRLGRHAALALSNARLLEQLETVNWETLYALARAVDANSPWTAGHSERVTRMALELAERLGIDDAERTVLNRGGLLHDIGKIGVPHQILEKRGRLTEHEFDVMRDHVRIGARILEPISGFRRELPLVLHHHERFDGRGYPDGLAGEQIPRLVRILSVADVFDALASERPYRAGWPRERVVQHIVDGSGTQFDPDVVAAFVELTHDSHWNLNAPGESSCLSTDTPGSTDSRIDSSS